MGRPIAGAEPHQCFFETLHTQDEPDLPFWRKLLIAVGRVTESDDDEICYSHYCATVTADQVEARPYVRSFYSRRLFGITMRIYRRHHIHKLTQMVAKAVGVDPQGRTATMASALMWRTLRVRAGLSGVPSEAAA